jgi:hypothetical protein
MIALLGLPESEEWRGLGGQRPVRIRTREELARLPDDCILVYRCGREAAARGGEVAAAVQSRQARVLAVVPDEALAYRDMVECAVSASEVHAIRDGEPVERKVTELLAARSPSAEGKLLAHIGPTVNRAVRCLVGAAVLSGRTRVGAGELARVVGMPDRSVRRRLAGAGLATPADLPAFSTGVFLAADIQFRGLSLSNTARARGFTGTDDLRRYLVARTDATPSQWMAMGFEDAVAFAGRTMRAGVKNPLVGGENPQVGGENHHGERRA